MLLNTIPASPSACKSGAALVAADYLGLEPGEIALELFDHVPSGMIAHAVHDNDSAPLIRKGEIAIIEMAGGSGWYPTRGGLYLIEWGGLPDLTDREGRRRSRRSWAIVQTREGKNGWWHAGAYRSSPRTGIRWADGPYEMNDLAEKLIGRVVGLYAPSRRGGC